jgi:hypothetical protein
LEYLKTHGVPVLSCEQDNFAAFYTRDSGYRADFRLGDAADQRLGRRRGRVQPRPLTQARTLEAVITGRIWESRAETPSLTVQREVSMTTSAFTSMRESGDTEARTRRDGDRQIVAGAFFAPVSLNYRCARPTACPVGPGAHSGRLFRAAARRASSACRTARQRAPRATPCH